MANTRLGQTKLALEDYNRAVELFPEYPVAYNNRGNLLLSIGQLGEAMKDFDRALLLAPGYAAAYSNRGNAKLKLGKPAEAIADFTKAIELMPASAAPLVRTRPGASCDRQTACRDTRFLARRQRRCPLRVCLSQSG